jgi:hypothetical protein
MRLALDDDVGAGEERPGIGSLTARLTMLDAGLPAPEPVNAFETPELTNASMLAHV